MVGANILSSLHDRLAAITDLPAVSFGGISVLPFGDFQQLAAVRETPVYRPAKHGLQGLADLWGNNFQLFELTQIMRQNNDRSLAELLGRLRVGMHTPDDIAVLKSRTVASDDPAIASLPEI